MQESMGIMGKAHIQHFRKGKLIHEETVHNLITTRGDEYYAKKAIVGIAPASATAPTAATGMKLGSGTTTPAKSSSGSALTTYVSTSNNLFDSSYPQTEDLTGDTGWNVVYQVTWAAGDVTATVSEAVIVTDAATNATTAEANTHARVTFTAVDKGADDSLIITWKHKFLGA